MSCTGCASKFTIFKGEKSCPRCGYLFCSKCLTEKALVPKTGSSKPVAVCRDCASAKRSNNEAKSSSNLYSDSDLPARPKITPPTKTVVEFSKTIEDDEKIRQRLEKLREDKLGSTVSQSQLEDRLAILKGVDPEKARTASQMPFHIPKDNRTQAEQTRDLMSRYYEEVAIDSKRLRPEDEIAQRLAKLRDLPPPDVSQKQDVVNPRHFAGPSTAHDDWSTKDLDDVNKLLQTYSSKSEKTARAGLKELCNDSDVQNYLKNVKQKPSKSKINLPRSSSESSDEDEEKQAELELQRIENVMKLEDLEDDLEVSGAEAKKTDANDELPYCCICNEDPIFRCTDCDDDLYCKRCFKEGHDKEDGHRVIDYKVKKIAR